MNRAKIFFGGILAAISMTAAPAFARPAFRAEVEGDSYGYRSHKLSYEVELENRVLELVNDVRARYGLSEMRFDFRGQRAARSLVVEAAREGSFHDISKGVKQRLGDQDAVEAGGLVRLGEGPDIAGIHHRAAGRMDLRLEPVGDHADEFERVGHAAFLRLYWLGPSTCPGRSVDSSVAWQGKVGEEKAFPPQTPPLLSVSWVVPRGRCQPT